MSGYFRESDGMTFWIDFYKKVLESNLVLWSVKVTFKNVYILLKDIFYRNEIKVNSNLPLPTEICFKSSVKVNLGRNIFVLILMVVLYHANKRQIRYTLTEPESSSWRK